MGRHLGFPASGSGRGYRLSPIAASVAPDAALDVVVLIALGVLRVGLPLALSSIVKSVLLYYSRAYKGETHVGNGLPIVIPCIRYCWLLAHPLHVMAVVCMEVVPRGFQALL